MVLHIDQKINGSPFSGLRLGFFFEGEEREKAWMMITYLLLGLCFFRCEDNRSFFCFVERHALSFPLLFQISNDVDLQQFTDAFIYCRIKKMI